MLITFDNLAERAVALAALRGLLADATATSARALAAIHRSQAGVVPETVIDGLHGPLVAERTTVEEQEASEAWLDYGTALLRHHGLRLIDRVATAKSLGIASQAWAPSGMWADDFVRLAAMASPRWMASFEDAVERRFLDAVVTARTTPGDVTETAAREAAVALRAAHKRSA